MMIHAPLPVIFGLIGNTEIFPKKSVCATGKIKMLISEKSREGQNIASSSEDRKKISS